MMMMMNHSSCKLQCIKYGIYVQPHNSGVVFTFSSISNVYLDFYLLTLEHVLRHKQKAATTNTNVLYSIQSAVQLVP